MRTSWLMPCSLALMATCSNTHPPPEASTTGADPVLPAPQRSLIPTVDIAPATGWPEGVMPRPASGLAITRFAGGLDHPRWLLVLPNGDVLVAETNAPPGKGGVKGIKGKIMGVVMKKAGAGHPAPTASPCCGMPTTMASRKSGSPFSPACIRPSAWPWWGNVFTSLMRIHWSGSRIGQAS